MTTNPLGDMLRKAREVRGWTLMEASGKLGINRNHLHDIETGRSCNPVLTTLAAVVAVYGIDPRAFFWSDAVRPTVHELENILVGEPGLVAVLPSGEVCATGQS